MLRHTVGQADLVGACDDLCSEARITGLAHQCIGIPKNAVEFRGSVCCHGVGNVHYLIKVCGQQLTTFTAITMVVWNDTRQTIHTSRLQNPKTKQHATRPSRKSCAPKIMPRVTCVPSCVTPCRRACLAIQRSDRKCDLVASFLCFTKILCHCQSTIVPQRRCRTVLVEIVSINRKKDVKYRCDSDLSVKPAIFPYLSLFRADSLLTHSLQLGPPNLLPAINLLKEPEDRQSRAAVLEY